MIEQDLLRRFLFEDFEQSEQLKTRLWLFANDTHAAGLLLQELPSPYGDKADWGRMRYWQIRSLSRNCWNWTANICCIDCLMKKKSGCLMLNRLNFSAPVPVQESKEHYARWAKRNWKTYYRSTAPFKSAVNSVVNNIFLIRLM